MTREPNATQALQDELDGLIYAVSHDLRAPVRAIKGFAEALHEQLDQDGLNLGSDAQRYLDRLNQSAHKLQLMMDGLLMLSRIARQPITLTSINVHALCHSIRQQRPGADQPLIEVAVADDLQLQADPALLEMALQALLDNAIRFARRSEQPHVTIAATQHDDQLSLCVSDNGPGFDMQYLDRLGVPFQHLHADAQLVGVGLGLATVKRITNRFGATLVATSSRQQGSRFCLHWPITQPS